MRREGRREMRRGSNHVYQEIEEEIAEMQDGCLGEEWEEEQAWLRELTRLSSEVFDDDDWEDDDDDDWEDDAPEDDEWEDDDDDDWEGEGEEDEEIRTIFAGQMYPVEDVRHARQLLWGEAVSL